MIFDFDALKSLNSQALNRYGNKEIVNLAKYYLLDDPKYSLEISLVLFQWDRLGLRIVRY